MHFLFLVVIFENENNNHNSFQVQQAVVSQTIDKVEKHSFYQYHSRISLHLKNNKEVEVVYVNYPNFVYCILVNEIHRYQKLMSELTDFAGDEFVLSGSRFYFNILLSFQINAMRKIIG